MIQTGLARPSVDLAYVAVGAQSPDPGSAAMESRSGRRLPARKTSQGLHINPGIFYDMAELLQRKSKTRLTPRQNYGNRENSSNEELRGTA